VSFSAELEEITSALTWAENTPIPDLEEAISASEENSLLAVGSGGSLTGATMASMLHQSQGPVSKACPPLEFMNSRKSVSESSILLLSASGSNADILSAFKFAATVEPPTLITLSTQTDTELNDLQSEYQFARTLEYDLPTGRDGFLATNTLLATCILLTRAYLSAFETEWKSPEITDRVSDRSELDPASIPRKESWTILYGGWGRVPAVDFESKFTEAALGHVQLSDYRNFGHGRHHWLAKRGEETCVLALITPREREIAQKTISRLPDHVTVLCLETELVGPSAALELLAKIFRVVELRGQHTGIEPSSPGVPEFGRKIYRLSPPHKDGYTTRPDHFTRRETAAISRKIGYSNLLSLTREEQLAWRKSYRRYRELLESKEFAAVVFDYDGTLCGPSERFSGPSDAIASALTNLLENDITVGVATGRGKSAGEDLRAILPETHWSNVFMGYYNGSDIALLSDKKRPNKGLSTNKELKRIVSEIEKDHLLSGNINIDVRPNQISITSKRGLSWQKTMDELMDLFALHSSNGVSLLHSSHSIDILAPSVSKIDVIKECTRTQRKCGKKINVLCIGDKGKWPGNDYELLSHKFSLSVNEVSARVSTCWNISEPGHRGPQATLDILESIERGEGEFKIML